MTLVQTLDTQEKLCWHTKPQDPAPSTARVSWARHAGTLGHPHAMNRRAPQLLLSEVVSTQVGFSAVPHCVLPAVQVKRQVPRLQIVMA